MQEVERHINLIDAVCNDPNWRSKFGWHQVKPTLRKIADLARLGFLAAEAGFSIGKNKEGKPVLLTNTGATHADIPLTPIHTTVSRKEEAKA